MFPRARLLLTAACLLAAAAPARAVAPTPSIVSASTGSINFSWTGGAAPFTAAISTAPSFSVTLASGTLNTSATSYPFLDPDTTYYFKVKSAGAAEPYSAVLTTITWVATPSGIFTTPAYFLADSSYTAIASVGWNTGGNPEWTRYEVAYNTGGADTVDPYINPTGAPIDISGLQANTTYFFRVRARGLTGTRTPYTAAASTSTLALRVSGLGDSVFETSATITWTAVDHATIQALDSEGYRLELADNFALDPLAASWTTGDSAAASRTFSSLSRNTTYYYRAGTLNWPGNPNMSQVRSFTTLTQAPQALARLAVADGSATLGWTALGADAAMGYRLEAATGTFSAGETVHSSATYITSHSTLTLTTLDPNTTYYFRAAGLNKAYAPNYGAWVSSVTLALPVSAGLAAASAEPQAITVSFTPLPEAPQPFACEGYRLEASTTAFGAAATVYSSVTYTYQDGQRALTIGGLAPNNTYYLRLATLNWERTPNYTVLPSTKTGFPGPLTAVALAGIWSSSAAVSFNSGTAAEGHVAEASVYPFFNNIAASSATPSAAATGLVISGLAANTTYYFRAGALYNGTTIYANAAPAFRQTLAAPLSAVGFADVFRSSATVSWAPFTGSAKGLRLQVSPSASFSPVLASSDTINIALSSLTVAGLSPNTSYYFRAATINDEDYTNYVNAPTTSTLANPPVERPFGLTPDSMTLNWLVNSNPSDTRYLAELDNDPDFSSPLPSSTTLISSATFSGLSPNTTYYSRVTAINRLGRRIPAVNFSDMATDAYDPAPLAASGVGAYGLTANWGDGGNLAGTYYVAAISSNTDFSGTVHSSTTLAQTASFTGLVSNASYYMRVSALNLTGVPTDPATTLATTLTLPTTALMLPKPQTYSNMMIDGFSVTWEPNGNSSHTWYYVQASTMSDFSVINSSRLVNALTCTFSDLMIDADYWVRVQARGQAGAQSAYESAGSTRTLLSIQDNALTLEQNLVELQTSYGTISILLPKGSIGSSTKLTVLPSTVTLPAPASAVSVLTPTGIGVIINHFPPTLVLKALTITLPYRTADLPPGIDRSRLVLALYDEKNSVWVPLPSVSDTAGNKVTGQTWHLSTFQLMQSNPGAGLAAVKIYPNPYRPNSVSDVMHFANMPPGARVKIYTFLGELVRSLKADVNGMASWDGLNDSGRAAASGVYIAFIKSGGSGKSFKIALER